MEFSTFQTHLQRIYDALGTHIWGARAHSTLVAALIYSCFSISTNPSPISSSVMACTLSSSTLDEVTDFTHMRTVSHHLTEPKM